MSPRVSLTPEGVSTPTCSTLFPVVSISILARAAAWAQVPVV